MLQYDKCSELSSDILLCMCVYDHTQVTRIDGPYNLLGSMMI